VSLCACVLHARKVAPVFVVQTELSQLGAAAPAIAAELAQALSHLVLFVYRAADWQLDTPDWTGRLRVVSKGRDVFIKLEDKVSGG